MCQVCDMMKNPNLAKIIADMRNGDKVCKVEMRSVNDLADLVDSILNHDNTKKVKSAVEEMAERLEGLLAKAKVAPETVESKLAASVDFFKRHDAAMAWAKEAGYKDLADAADHLKIMVNTLKATGYRNTSELIGAMQRSGIKVAGHTPVVAEASEECDCSTCARADVCSGARQTKAGMIESIHLAKVFEDQAFAAYMADLVSEYGSSEEAIVNMHKVLATALTEFGVKVDPVKLTTVNKLRMYLLAIGQMNSLEDGKLIAEEVSKLLPEGGAILATEV